MTDGTRATRTGSLTVVSGSLPQNTHETGPRLPDGKFAPGCSGNAGGRPRAIEHIRDLARQHSKTAIASLVKIATTGKNESARVSACAELLSRGWGRPTQLVAGDDTLPPIGFTVEDIAARRAAAKATLDEVFGREGGDE